jgi:hypothetical protein
MSVIGPQLRLAGMFIVAVAGLSGGQAPPAAPGTKGENCIVMVIWNPEFFSGLDHMKAQAAKYNAA